MKWNKKKYFQFLPSLHFKDPLLIQKKEILAEKKLQVFTEGVYMEFLQ